MKFISTVIILILLIVVIAGCQKTSVSDAPKVRLISVKKVFHNGEHNAFTDLARFNGKFYLGFRSSPDGHSVFSGSSIIVLSSEDGEEWEKVHQFGVANRDVRDAHFLVFKNKLFVYTGTWYCEGKCPDPDQRDINQHLGYCAWTEDGRDWTGPVMLEGTYGHYIWRAAEYNGKAYICGRRKHQFIEMPSNDESRRITESAMLESEDGIIWKKTALFQEYNGDETAFLFEPDGSVLALARRGRGNAELCRSEPPYDAWDRKDLDRYVGGPLIVKWGGRYFAGGRMMIGDGPRTTRLYWLVNDQLKECLLLPSAGDNSYPGFIELSPTRALISYYSSHEKDENGEEMTAIYLANIEIEE